MYDCYVYWKNENVVVSFVVLPECTCTCIFLFLVGESSGWCEYRTKDGHSYYHNFTTGESQWERPESYNGQSPQLSKDEIQVGEERE